MELNFQYAHQADTETESHPISRREDVLSAFDEFDWSGEVEKANKLQKCSPTLSLLLDGQNHMIWVSAYEDTHEIMFVSASHFPGEVSGFLGFGKKQGTVRLDTGGFSHSQAREALQLFIADSHEQLKSLYENA